MKTFISMTKYLGVIAAVALTITACQNSSPQNGARGRTPYPPNTVTSPRTGAQVSTSWGTITNPAGGNFSPYQLSLLTNGASGLGSVSGNANDTTGVLFGGQIDPNTGNGQVAFEVWDSYAATGGDPLYWTMPVVQLSAQGSNGATVIVQTGDTVFNFSGQFNGQYWQGTFSAEDPNSGNLTQIGSFQAVTCSIFICN